MVKKHKTNLMQFFSRTFISCNIPKERSLWLGVPKECISKAKVTTGYSNNSIISCVWERGFSAWNKNVKYRGGYILKFYIPKSRKKFNINAYAILQNTYLYILPMCVGGWVWVWNTLGFSPEEG